MTLVIAHRGAWGPAASGAPAGNTLEAFEQAIAVGADMIELDVRRTYDGQLIVHHDARIKAVPISSLHYDALKTRRARAQPPLLAEVLALARGRIALNLELKEPGYVEEAVALLGRFDCEGCLVSSFLDEVLLEVKTLAPGLRTGLLIVTGMRRALTARLPATKADCLVAHRRLADLSALSRAAAAGVPCVVWTVNGTRAIDRYLDHPAVEGVITDRPALALSRRALLQASTGGAGGARRAA